MVTFFCGQLRPTGIIWLEIYLYAPLPVPLSASLAVSANLKYTCPYCFPYFHKEEDINIENLNAISENKPLKTIAKIIC